MASDFAHRLSWEQALAWRMERHRLVERAVPSDLIRVVGQICGLHAQLMSSAELSLWARIDGLQCDAVHETLWKRRALVKLWAMRGTLYLLPSAELGLWLSALGTYTNRGNTGHPETDVLAEAVGRALEGRLLTREELGLKVEQITGAQSFGERVRFSWGSYLKAVSFRGILCFAPSEGGRVRFTTPTTWVRSEIDKPDSVDALREVTRRFLDAYAALTVEDLAQWWGFGPARGARMLAALGDEAGRSRRRESARLGVGAGRARHGIRQIAQRGTAAPGIRPVGDRRLPPRRSAARSRAQGAHLPRARLDLAGAARERSDGRRLEAYAQGPATIGRDRTLRHVVGLGSRAARGRGGAPRRVP
jgi:hypothetical protein